MKKILMLFCLCDFAVAMESPVLNLLENTSNNAQEVIRISKQWLDKNSAIAEMGKVFQQPAESKSFVKMLETKITSGPNMNEIYQNAQNNIPMELTGFSKRVLRHF